MSHISAGELVRRLKKLDRHVADSKEFERHWPLELEAPASALELDEVEREIGVRLPEPWRTFLLEVAGAGRFRFSVRPEFADAFAGGLHGGFELVSPNQMKTEHDRVTERFGGSLAAPFIPLFKEPDATAWLCLLETARGTRIARLCQPEDLVNPPRWHVDDFFDGWVCAGCPVQARWDDQAEAMVERFSHALGLQPEASDRNDVLPWATYSSR